MLPSVCANCCWKAAACTPYSIAPAAPSRARASRPSCCSLRRGPRRAKSGITSSTPAATWARPTRPTDSDFAEFVQLQKTFADSPKSWSVDAKSIDPATFDLSVKNPNGGEAVVHRSPQDIMDEIATLDAESAAVLETIRGLL